MLSAENITWNCECSPQVTVRAWREQGCTIPRVQAGLVTLRWPWRNLGRVFTTSRDIRRQYFYVAWIFFHSTIFSWTSNIKNISYLCCVITISWFMNKIYKFRKLEVDKGREEGLENQFYIIIFLPLSLIFLKKKYSKIMNNFA